MPKSADKLAPNHARVLALDGERASRASVVRDVVRAWFKLAAALADQARTGKSTWPAGRWSATTLPSLRPPHCAKPVRHHFPSSPTSPAYLLSPSDCQCYVLDCWKLSWPHQSWTLCAYHFCPWPYHSKQPARSERFVAVHPAAAPADHSVRPRGSAHAGTSVVCVTRLIRPVTTTCTSSVHTVSRKASRGIPRPCFLPKLFCILFCERLQKGFMSRMATAPITPEALSRGRERRLEYRALLHEAAK
ncbi:hypothetical protein ANO11243_013110 [Dothideomycetidae sp. 11243]|nr:hypothetical protein ANO11243_013110 [fungal sp. No.11243]